MAGLPAKNEASSIDQPMAEIGVCRTDKSAARRKGAFAQQTGA